jgi:hypothetical protein
MNSSNLTPQQKKEYLLNRYVKRDYSIDDIESSKKYAVYFCPNIELVKEWKLVHICSSLPEAKQQIAWRKQYSDTNDGDLVIDNDKRFETWRDETKNVDNNGNYLAPTDAHFLGNYDGGNMLQVIANSTPAQSTNGFKGLAHYSGIEIGNYKGFYKIEELYEI